MAPGKKTKVFLVHLAPGKAKGKGKLSKILKVHDMTMTMRHLAPGKKSAYGTPGTR